MNFISFMRFFVFIAKNNNHISCPKWYLTEKVFLYVENLALKNEDTLVACRIKSYHGRAHLADLIVIDSSRFAGYFQP